MIAEIEIPIELRDDPAIIEGVLLRAIKAYDSAPNTRYGSLIWYQRVGNDLKIQVSKYGNNGQTDYALTEQLVACIVEEIVNACRELQSITIRNLTIGPDSPVLSVAPERKIVFNGCVLYKKPCAECGKVHDTYVTCEWTKELLAANGMTEHQRNEEAYKNLFEYVQKEFMMHHMLYGVTNLEELKQMRPEWWQEIENKFKVILSKLEEIERTDLSEETGPDGFTDKHSETGESSYTEWLTYKSQSSDAETFAPIFANHLSNVCAKLSEIVTLTKSEIVV